MSYGTGSRDTRSHDTRSHDTGSAERLPFSERLRLETSDARGEAESAVYFRLLLSGALEPHEYATLMFQYHGVYLELCQAAEGLRDDPCAGPFIADHPCGLDELERDLFALLGPEWRERAYLTDAAVAYRARVREVAASPAAFVAHHYVRYLSTLTVGQLIREAVTHVYDLDGSAAGVSFFTLPPGASADDLKGHYRSLLDAAPWSAADHERVVEEARIAFRHNAAVSAALGEWIGSGTSVRSGR